MSISETAMAFFDACETGRGWDACRPWCAEDAGFACQAEMLADVTTLAGYCDWMKGLIEAVPDGRYEMKAHGPGADGASWMAYAVFKGTMKDEAGGAKPIASDYVYVMTFDGGKVAGMTKIWNDKAI